MSERNAKQLPATDNKRKIQVKNSPAAVALKKAPDEAIARAIHDALVKQKEGK